MRFLFSYESQSPLGKNFVGIVNNIPHVGWNSKVGKFMKIVLASSKIFLVMVGTAELSLQPTLWEGYTFDFSTAVRRICRRFTTVKTPGLFGFAEFDDMTESAPFEIF